MVDLKAGTPESDRLRTYIFETKLDFDRSSEIETDRYPSIGSEDDEDSIGTDHYPSIGSEDDEDSI